MRTLLLAVAAAGLLTACATPTPYQASSREAPYGFQEQTIEGNRVRLTFSGNSLTNRETVETYLLYRAAELTLERGLDYFVIADRDTEEHSRLQNFGPRRYPFGYRYYHPRFGWAPWHDPFWDDSNYREVTRYEAIAEVAMFNGRKPDGDPNAFDAREVQRNLQGQIVRPQPQ